MHILEGEQFPFRCPTGDLVLVSSMLGGCTLTLFDSCSMTGLLATGERATLDSGYFVTMTRHHLPAKCLTQVQT